MALIKETRTLTRYEVSKATAESDLGLDPVIEWSTDGRYLIAEHAETTDTAPPPFTRKNRNFTLIELHSIYDTLGIPPEFHTNISVGFDSTLIIFYVVKEL